jgi:hypothetical protein
MGHDYSLYLPNTLAGYYWFLENGPLAVPWFTPAQCGGVPYFADFTTGYFTLPQWLTIALSPIAAVRVSFALFAALGAIGFYVLLRGRFTVTCAAAAAGSVLFLFSGFYAYRLAVGHVIVHAFALTPWLAWAVLARRPEKAARTEVILSAAWYAVLGGAIVAYMFQASMMTVIPPAGIAVAVLLLIHGHMHGHRVRPWALLAAAALVSCALSASRLVAMISFLQNFPRTDYPLPGFADPWSLLGAVATALFWRVSAPDIALRVENSPWHLGQHEWEYGVGPGALGLLVAGAIFALARFVRDPRPVLRIARSVPVWAAVGMALALPLVLNWYEPRWNDLLKSLPFFGSSSTLLRWFALYIPVVALLGALALHRVAPGAKSGVAAAALVVLVTIGWNAAADKSYYTGQPYNGSPIEAAWRDARSSGSAPPISEITVTRLRSGRVAMPIDRNNALTLGRSQLACYQPVFGYRLERFPVRPLRPGPALDEVAPGVLNVKNPACYLYPRENACMPGRHFRTSRRDDAARFLSYGPFPFARSPRQFVADYVTLAALFVSAAVLLGSLFLALRRRFRTRPGDPA